MSARIPLLKKTPFVLDPRPLTEASSAHAGLLATSRAYGHLRTDYRQEQMGKVRTIGGNGSGGTAEDGDQVVLKIVGE